MAWEATPGRSNVSHMIVSAASCIEDRRRALSSNRVGWIPLATTGKVSAVWTIGGSDMCSIVGGGSFAMRLSS